MKNRAGVEARALCESSVDQQYLFPTLLRWVLVLNRALRSRPYSPPPASPLLSSSLLRASLPHTWSSLWDCSSSLLHHTLLLPACELASYLVIPVELRSAKLSPLSRAAGGSSGVRSYGDSDYSSPSLGGCDPRNCRHFRGLLRGPA